MSRRAKRRKQQARAQHMAQTRERGPKPGQSMLLAPAEKGHERTRLSPKSKRRRVQRLARRVTRRKNP